MRVGDIDKKTDPEFWLYRLPTHKTQKKWINSWPNWCSLKGKECNYKACKREKNSRHNGRTFIFPYTLWLHRIWLPILIGIFPTWRRSKAILFLFLDILLMPIVGYQNQETVISQVMAHIFRAKVGFNHFLSTMIISAPIKHFHAITSKRKEILLYGGYIPIKRLCVLRKLKPLH